MKKVCENFSLDNSIKFIDENQEEHIIADSIVTKGIRGSDKTKYVLDLNEEKLISYEWHFSDDGKEATLVELLGDSDGYMQRLKNHMASPIAVEITDLVDFKGWHIYGNAKPDLKEALKPMGATFQNYFFGFNHSI